MFYGYTFIASSLIETIATGNIFFVLDSTMI